MFRTFSWALFTSFPYSLIVQNLLFGIILFFPIFSNCSGSSLRHYPLLFHILLLFKTFSSALSSLSHILLLFKTFSSALSSSFPYSLVVQDLLFGIIHFFPIFSCCSGPSLRHYPHRFHIPLLYNVHPLPPAVTKKYIVNTGDHRSARRPLSKVLPCPNKGSQ